MIKEELEESSKQTDRYQTEEDGKRPGGKSKAKANRLCISAAGFCLFRIVIPFP